MSGRVASASHPVSLGRTRVRLTGRLPCGCSASTRASPGAGGAWSTGVPGARPTALGVGRHPHAWPELDLELRLLELHTAVTALLREHRPDVVAIERVFTQNNKGTAMGTAQAAGVAALAAAQADRPVAWHTPSEVKAAISGNGRADKEQVTMMVTRVLGLADAAQAGRRRRRPRAGDLPRLARPGAAAAAGRRARRRDRRAGAPTSATTPAALDGGARTE